MSQLRKQQKLLITFCAGKLIYFNLLAVIDFKLQNNIS